MSPRPQHPPDIHRRPLSAELASLAATCAGLETITFRTIMRGLGRSGYSVLVLFLSLPFLQPIPVPGLSTPCGLAIAFVGWRLATAQRPWLPKAIQRRAIPARYIRIICEKGAAIMRRVEKVVRPRGKWIHRLGIVRQANGFMMAICGILLALPVPLPGTNPIPAIPIFLISLGEVEEDGLFNALGWIAFFVNLSFWILVPFFGYEGIKELLHLKGVSTR